VKKNDPKGIVIIRFMGTSRGSSTIKSVFVSILNQLEIIFENKLNIQETKDNFGELEQMKEKLINKLNLFNEKFPSRKLVILLDSIDQLSKQDYYLEWMFYELPKNVKIIYSVLNKYEGIFNKLKTKLENNYLEMKTLCYDEAQSIMVKLLINSNRQLTTEQWLNIDEVFGKTIEIYPLHVKLLFDISSKWTSSYKVPDELKKCICSKDTIKYLFKNLEQLYGKILFSHCIFYLTLFDYKGISERELEDILSIDDDVLTSVFEYHHPSVRRFPIALWVRIKYELKDYITNKETDEVPVISW
jgi:hypothetical protein